MPPRTVLVLLPLIVLGACVTEVASGRARSTAPLRIETRVQSGSHTVREQVGTVQHTNAAGQSAGSSAIYANRTYATSQLKWRPYQGNEPISDEDFFRFIGDEPAAAASRAYRRRGRWLVRIGIASAIVGTGALIAGGVLDEINLIIAGGIGLGLGPSVAYFGYAYLHPESHAVPYARARDGLAQVQRTQGAAVPVTPLPVAITGRW
jgi:hypothetical protein